MVKTQEHHNPTTQRIALLDSLRGFALCAICFMNIELFTRPLTDIQDGISQNLTGLNWFADAFIYVFLHGKGWAMFTLLFGVSYGMLGHNRTRWIRRVTMLLGIGLIHAIAIWSGDILVTYAVAGFALALLPQLNDKKTALLGVILATLPLLITLAKGVAAANEPTTHDPSDTLNLAQRASEIAAYSQGTWAQATHMRWEELKGHDSGWWLFIPVVMGMVLIGKAIYQSGVITAQAGTARLRRWLLIGAGSTGAAVMIASLVTDPNPQLVAQAVPGTAVLAAMLQIAAAPLLGIALLCGLVEAHEAWPAARRAMQPLASLGRLSLSVYLAQSVIGTTLFYGYGFGLWGHVGRAGQALLCVLVLAIQLRVARWYVERFAYGPVEWVWRWGTNGTMPMFRLLQHSNTSSITRTATEAL